MTKPISRAMAVNCLLWLATKATPYYVFVCQICGDELHAEENVQFDHYHAIVFDGPHEYQNLRPVHAECHKKKTARDIKDNAKIKRIIADKPSKHPMPKSHRKIASRLFQKRKSA